MKKKLLFLICALALLIGCIAMTTMAATNTKTGYCEYCKQPVTWEPIQFGTHSVPSGETAVHKHFYFDKDYTHSANMQILAKGGVTLCIDLNGKSWDNLGRAFAASYTTSNTDWSTINIQDSVGGAVVTSHAISQHNSGSNIYVARKCTVNIYGGTFTTEAEENEQGLSPVNNGGVASVENSGNLNVHGGTLRGCKVNQCGGTVYLAYYGRLNVRGGALISGSSGNGTGNCVGLAPHTTTYRSYVTLSGNAHVDDIFFPKIDSAQLVVDSAFTGSANLTFSSGLTLANGTTVGTVKNSAAVTGDLYCTNGDGYSVAVSGTSLNLAAPSAEDVRHDCPYCKINTKWLPFTATAPTNAGIYHYYLTGDYTTTTPYAPAGGAQVCLDLNGHTYSAAGRAVYLSDKAILNVLDTGSSGEIRSVGGSNNPDGGTVHVSAGTVFNFYSGTLGFTHDAATSDWGGTGRGGVIYNAGTVNVHGGKILGGEVVDCTYEFTGIEGVGGAIYSTGTLNILGGEITSGSCPDTGAGPCIYIDGAENLISLSGNAKVADIYFTVLNNERFSVNADFSGIANLTFPESQALHQGLVVGVSSLDPWPGTINCTGPCPTVLPTEGNLVLSAYPAGTVAATGGTGYTSLQTAIDAAPKGALVELVKPCSSDITINKNICLQLNSCNITGTVTVAKGCTLYGMDSATDDYSVAGNKYGKLTKVAGEGNVAGVSVDNGVSEHSYLMVNQSGVISFHCVTLQIYAMSLRVTDIENEPGLYYKSHFLADEIASPLLQSYGVALSIRETPNAQNLDNRCIYSIFTQFESGPNGNLGNASSTLLKGIMKNSNTNSINLRNLGMCIYGRAYAKSTDGQILFGKGVSRSLADQLKGIDKIVNTLSSTQTKAVTDLYHQFKTVLQTQELNNIAKIYTDKETGTLKVLVLGNSHGLDATNLLYEVFHQERLAGSHDQDVLIAALYYSGCNMDQHHDFLLNNKKVYTYHKNDGSQPNRTWVVKDSTCLDALQDEQWDIIFMQQMNHRAGIDANYDDSWKFVADYLMNNQDVAPKLGFYMTWTNPDDYELYLNDDAPLRNRADAYWRANHEHYWSTNGKYDQNKLYKDIMRCVQQYLVDDTSLVGRPYDLILPVATAIEYAQDVRGRTQPEIYRDYTHMNDYGRLIAAYTWYAKIMELEKITAVNTNVIPALLKHNNSRYPSVTNAAGDYIVDDQMKADLIASVNWALKNPFSLPEN